MGDVPPFSSSSATDIMARVDAFSVYNISRIRELLRTLSPRQYALFTKIPVWLHMNLPQVPGFIRDPKVPFGIYRFHQSGFWKQEVDRSRLAGKDLRPRLSPAAAIQGVYLMGSSGTLAQTAHSDFDYWIIVDKKEFSKDQEVLLLQKLAAIEAHCREHHGQNVTFFLMDVADTRENRFPPMNAESSGSAQKTFLKEEFYRTFILIGGRIPYWAVLPAGLSDEAYRNRVKAAEAERHLRFLPEDFIDLGNLAVLDLREGIGALLWQVSKARTEPAKSMIKAALIAHHIFSAHTAPLCDTVKERYFSRPEGGDPLWDPYGLMFDRTLSFFRDLEDPEGLNLLRECIFLRLDRGCFFSSARDLPPREVLLKKYVGQWHWDEARIRRLEAYASWPEPEKLLFERLVFEKISFLYDLVLKGEAVGETSSQVSDGDLLLLTRKIAGHYRREAGKIPPCSAHVLKNRATLQFRVTEEASADAPPLWRVSLAKSTPLYESRSLLGISAWLISNGLHEGVLTFQTPGREMTERQAVRFFKRVCDIVAEDLPTSPQNLPHWERIVLSLHGNPGEKNPSRADFLAMNSWREFFFDTLPLDQEPALAWYRVAEHIWMFARPRFPIPLPYRILTPTGAVPEGFSDEVERILRQFRQTLQDLATLAQNASDPAPPLLLDR